MKKLFLLLLSASLALSSACLQARAADRRHDGDVMRETGDLPGRQTLAYGSDPLQRIDYWPAARPDAPLVIFVHGGGWQRGDKFMMNGSAKLKHWRALGYGVASVNYRLVPANTVEEQASDLAAAVAHLKSRAGQLRFDAGRMALVGHSAGAHLVALAGTDPAYFRAAGLSHSDVRGIVSLDGACYDVPRQIAEGAGFMRDTYLQAFGADPARQRQLSPIAHAGGSNAPAFLILHVERKDGAEQSRALGNALRRAGTPAAVQGFAGRGLRGHAEMNRRLGEEVYPATAVVDAFFERVFAGP